MSFNKSRILVRGLLLNNDLDHLFYFRFFLIEIWLWMQVQDKKGRDIWVPVEVNIDDHIVEANVDTSDPTYVENYVTDLAIAPPLDVKRPMWQFHVLNGTSGNAAGHMIVRVHHALGDGTSLMSLLLACTRRLGSPDELPAVPVARRRERERKSAFRHILSLLNLFWNTLVGVFLFTSTAIWLKDSESVIKGHTGVEKEKKKLNFVSLEMADMVTVKDSVNGVGFMLLCVISHALFLVGGVLIRFAYFLMF